MGSCFFLGGGRGYVHGKEQAVPWRPRLYAVCCLRCADVCVAVVEWVEWDRQGGGARWPRFGEPGRQQAQQRLSFRVPIVVPQPEMPEPRSNTTVFCYWTAGRGPFLRNQNV